MSTLPETLLAPDVQPRFADDCQDLVDHEVAEMPKACNTVRGSAIKHVKAALPALGALVQKYAG